MRVNLLSFVLLRKPTPAKATLSLERQLARDAKVLRVIDPSGLAWLAHLAADLRVRAELSTRVPVSSRAHYAVLWMLCHAPFLIGV